MKARIVVFIGVLLLICQVLFAQKSSGLNPKDWAFSANLPMTAYALNGGVAFDFPVEDGNHLAVNYFWSQRTKPMSGALTATFQVDTSSPLVLFNYKFEDSNTCVTPAHVRLLMARSDWNKYPNPDYENTRWWSNPIAYELVGGSVVQLKVPLIADQWSNIYGHFGNYSAATKSGFNSTLQHPAMIGFSFGGGCFFGHGVNVSNGTARFIVWGYTAG